LDSLDIFVTCHWSILELGSYFLTHWAQHRIWRSHSCRHSSKLCKPEMPGRKGFQGPSTWWNRV
jgi:hypothetical protein